jgi:2-(1,2-epoxy-1,2-dihydrophenyl)acetyl-CoA isomerase
LEDRLDDESAREVLVRDEAGVRVIALNRPDRLNALTPSLMLQLASEIRRAADDASVGCVVLTGTGRGFCSGGDLRDGGQRFEPDAERGGRTEQAYDQLRAYYEGPQLLHTMAKPTIAMVNGPVAGAGIGLLGACDIRFAGHSASFVAAFDRIGAGGDFGSTWFWTKILGSGVARELLMLGEKLSAEQAFTKGVYTKLLPDDALEAATMEAARRFADGPRMSWRYMKANLNLAEHASFNAALDHEALAMCLSTTAAATIARVSAKG